MGLFLPLVLCTLAACYTARSEPLMVPSPFSLLSRACNDSDVLAAAGSALQDINSDRKEGYILSLNRVHDAREHRQASNSPLSGAGVHISCIGSLGVETQRHTLAGALQIGNLMEALCSPLLGCATYMLLWPLETSANSILL